MAENFEIMRIDGLDYRRRDTESGAHAVGDDELNRTVAALAERGERVSTDAFASLIAHLASVHPAAYAGLITGLDVIALSDVTVLHDQTDALRLVAFIDRVYDAEIPLIASGTPLSDIFDAEMLQGGYRKKYLRAVSRMIALTNGEIPPHDS